jgi:hypothetical protein
MCIAWLPIKRPLDATCHAKYRSLAGLLRSQMNSMEACVFVDVSLSAFNFS